MVEVLLRSEAPGKVGDRDLRQVPLLGTGVVVRDLSHVPECLAEIAEDLIDHFSGAQTYQSLH